MVHRHHAAVIVTRLLWGNNGRTRRDAKNVRPSFPYTLFIVGFSGKRRTCRGTVFSAGIFTRSGDGEFHLRFTSTLPHEGGWFGFSVGGYPFDGFAGGFFLSKKLPGPVDAHGKQPPQRLPCAALRQDPARASLYSSRQPQKFADQVSIVVVHNAQYGSRASPYFELP